MCDNFWVKQKKTIIFGACVCVSVCGVCVCVCVFFVVRDGWKNIDKLALSLLLRNKFKKKKKETTAKEINQTKWEDTLLRLFKEAAGLVKDEEWLIELGHTLVKHLKLYNKPQLKVF